MKYSPGRALTTAITVILSFVATLSSQAATHYVNVNTSSFSPSTLGIGVGDTVIWINQDQIFSHTVTSTAGLWSPIYLINYQDSGGLIFNSAGTYNYYDQEDGFTGTVVVGVSVPSNDLCSGAIPMSSGVTYTANTTAATSTGDPTSSCGTIFHGVWYTITAPATGPVTVSTCGSLFDTTLAVYAGTCGSFTQIACNTDNGPDCTSINASLIFNATNGVTYYVLAGGNGTSGSLNITATLPGPSNDQCSGATAMTADTVYTMNTSAASATGDPTPSCGSISKGVWYKYTPYTSASVTVSTCGSDFDTILAVYTGSCGALTELAGGCDDDNGPSCTARTASVTFSATGGTTYYFLTGGYGGTTGNLQMTVTGGGGLPWQESAVNWDSSVMIAHPTSNFIYVVDTTNDRLLILNTDTGAFVSSIRLLGKTTASSLMCFSTNKNLLYVPLSVAQKVQVIALTNFSTIDVVPLTIAPGALAAGSDGMLYTMSTTPNPSFNSIAKINPVTGDKSALTNYYYSRCILKGNASGTRLYTLELGLSGGGSAVDEYTIVPGAMPTYVTNHFTSEANDSDLVIAEDVNWLYRNAGGVYGMAAWDMTARSYQYWPYGSPYGVAVAMVPNTSLVYGASGDSYGPRIRAFDRLTGAVSATYDIATSGRPTGSVNDRSLLVTPNGRIFYSRATRLLGLIGATSFSTNTPATTEGIDAGTNRTVFVGDTFNLSAAATFPSGADVYTWSKISGPGTVTFGTPANTNTTAQISVTGNYVLQITRSNSAGISRDLVLVAVQSRPIHLDSAAYSNGQFNFGFTSDPGSYIVESTSNFVQWTTVTNVSNSPGHIGIGDSPAAPQQFYRVRTP